MLVLTRRIGEEIMIAEEIRVTVIAIKGRHVSLGISAPTSIRVVRRELLAESGNGTWSNGDKKPARPAVARNGRNGMA